MKLFTEFLLKCLPALIIVAVGSTGAISEDINIRLASWLLMYIAIKMVKEEN